MPIDANLISTASDVVMSDTNTEEQPKESTEEVTEKVVIPVKQTEYTPAEKKKDVSGGMPDKSAAEDVGLSKPVSNKPLRQQLATEALDSAVKTEPPKLDAETMAAATGLPYVEPAPNEKIASYDTRIKYYQNLLKTEGLENGEGLKPDQIQRRNNLIGYVKMLTTSKQLEEQKDLSALTYTTMAEMAALKDPDNPYVGQVNIESGEYGKRATALAERRIREVEATKPAIPLLNEPGWKDVIASMVAQLGATAGIMWGGGSLSDSAEIIAETLPTIQTDVNVAMARAQEYRDKSNAALNKLYNEATKNYQDDLGKAYADAEKTMTSTDKLLTDDFTKNQIAKIKSFNDKRLTDLKVLKTQSDVAFSEGKLTVDQYKARIDTINKNVDAIKKENDSFSNYDKNSLVKAKIIDQFVTDKAALAVKEKLGRQGYASSVSVFIKQNVPPQDKMDAIRAENKKNDPIYMNDSKNAENAYGTTFSALSNAGTTMAQEGSILNKDKEGLLAVKEGIGVLKNAANNGTGIIFTKAAKPEDVANVLKNVKKVYSDGKITAVEAKILDKLGVKFIELKNEAEQDSFKTYYRDVDASINDALGVNLRGEEIVGKEALK
jgi:hypothetical protein